MWFGFARLWFESSVILYGSKTRHLYDVAHPVFESSVILYGSKTEVRQVIELA